MLLSSSISRSIISFFFFLAFIFAFMPDVSRAAAACTHYASPTGTGNGSSPSQPFKISDFWPVAGPGKTLCLMDGQYTGPASMITPPSGLSGTAATPITIRAINDGGVWINGQKAKNPLWLVNNDFFVIEGIDVSDSSGTTVLLDTGADNNIIRRTCAWNAGTSTTIWYVHNANDNLLEDVCGFGIGNKVFANVGGGNSRLTLRRAWGRWEQGNQIGPKFTFSAVYDTRGQTYENLIGTWNESGIGTTDQRYGISGTEKLAQSDQCANARFLGSIAYVRSVDTADSSAQGMGIFSSRSVDCIHFKDIVINIEGHASLRPIQAQDFDGKRNPTDPVINPPFGDRLLQNITQIGGGTSFVSTDSVTGWKVINRVDVSGVSAATSAGANPFQATSGNGARVCKRYVNGALTSQPLWPWPMDARINAALVRAGRNPSNYFRGNGNTMTSEIETQFGTIPSACKEASQQPALPAAPTVLLVRP